LFCRVHFVHTAKQTHAKKLLRNYLALPTRRPIQDKKTAFKKNDGITFFRTKKCTFAALFKKVKNGNTY